MFSDVKTTVTVIVGVVSYLVNKFLGIGIPESELIVVILFVLGLVAGDAKKR